MTETPDRKLTVILHADIVESTALVQLDESLSHERFQETFNNLSSLIEKHGGNVREIRGDAVVADFSRASDAISASLYFQRSNEARISEITDSIQPRVRIGIGMGEVILADQTVTGAGVVMAQRLEQLAEPGGVVIQSAVFETVPKHLPFRFASLGRHTLKGFDNAVETFSVSLEPEPDLPPADSQALTRPQGAMENTESAELALPDRPSIAVLPFSNMSDDKEQEYLSDGITEDITTALSRFSGLFVIARNSAFAYKGKSVDTRQIARELGVRYLLEGSVRRLGPRIRITGQLIDAVSGNHLWAEKFDGNIEDIFELQDEITDRIVASIAPMIEQAEMDRGRKLEAHEVTAYTLALKAKSQLNDAFQAGNSAELFSAIETADRALELDPRNAHALWVRAWALIEQYIYQWSDDPEGGLDEGMATSRKLIEVDPASASGHTYLGAGLMLKQQFDLAIDEFNRALELNPNSVTNLIVTAWGESLCGLTQEAKSHAQMGLRLSPKDLDIWLGVAYLALAQASFAEMQYEEAKKWAKLAIQMHASAPIRRALMIACCAFTNDLETASSHIEELDSFAPSFLKNILSRQVRFYSDKSTNEKLIEGLRKAGLK